MRKLFGLILGLILIGFCAASSSAQNNPQNKPKSKTRTITGCLSKGDNPDEYKLTAKSGSIFELRSGEASTMGNEKPVNLAEHVGHTVTVTGTVEKPEMPGMAGMKEEKQEGKEESGMKKHEHGNKPLELKVISLKHVSETCS